MVLETRFRNNNAANGEKLPGNSSKTLVACILIFIAIITTTEKDTATQRLSSLYRQELQKIEFKSLYTYWNQAIFSLKKKVLLLNSFPITNLRSAMHPKIIKLLSKTTL